MREINKKSLILILGLIFLIALIIRIIFVIYFPQRVVEYDAADYDALARNLLAGEGYSVIPGIPTAGREPGYPLFLAVIYYLFGHSFLIVRVVQAFLGALTSLMIYFLGKELYNKSIGIVAALAIALYPSHIGITGFLYTEIFYTFLLAVFTYALVKVGKTPTVKKFLALGFLLGTVTLTRGAILLFPVFILFGMFLIEKNRRKIWVNFTFLLVGMLAVLSLWITRNFITFNHFIPTATRSGIALWIGSDLPSQGMWPGAPYPPFEKILEEAKKEGLNEVETDKKFREEAIKNVKAHPKEATKLFFKKFVYLWGKPFGVHTLTELKGGLFLKPYLFFHRYLVITGLLGLLFSLRNWRKVLWPILILVYFSLIHMASVAHARYAIPLMPLVIVFFVYAHYALYLMICKRKVI